MRLWIKRSGAFSPSFHNMWNCVENKEYAHKLLLIYLGKNYSVFVQWCRTTRQMHQRDVWGKYQCYIYDHRIKVEGWVTMSAEAARLMAAEPTNFAGSTRLIKDHGFLFDSLKSIYTRSNKSAESAVHLPKCAKHYKKCHAFCLRIDQSKRRNQTGLPLFHSIWKEIDQWNPVMFCPSRMHLVGKTRVSILVIERIRSKCHNL